MASFACHVLQILPSCPRTTYPAPRCKATWVSGQEGIFTRLVSGKDHPSGRSLAGRLATLPGWATNPQTSSVMASPLL